MQNEEEERRCPAPINKWSFLPDPPRCKNPAGWYTTHPGFGTCSTHGGNKPRIQAAWRKAMTISDVLNVSPWDALLQEVQLSSGRIAWIDKQLVDAVAAEEERRVVAEMEDPGAPRSTGLGAGVKELMVESRAERRHRATVSKAAIDAGVAERVVRVVEQEGAIVATAIVAALDALSFLTVEQRTIAVAAAHSSLLALSAPKPGFTIEGELG